MNTCGTCKYFGELHEETVYREDADEIICKYHICDLLTHLNDCDPGKLERQELAGVIDGSGYYAAFCVTDEFGCNQWEMQSERHPRRT